MRYSRLCPVLVGLGWVAAPYNTHDPHHLFLAQLQEKRAGQSSKWMWTQLEDQVRRGSSACSDLTFAQVVLLYRVTPPPQLLTVLRKNPRVRATFESMRPGLEDGTITPRFAAQQLFETIVDLTGLDGLDGVATGSQEGVEH